MRASILLLVALQTTCVVNAEGDDDGPPWEYGAIFTMGSGTHKWIAQKVDGGYADPMMKIVVLKSSLATDEDMAIRDPEARRAFAKECQVVYSGGTLAPAKDKCYTIVFNDGAEDSTWSVDPKGAEHLAIFTEHYPTEFERDMHYLQDSKGEDVEPVVEWSPPAPWGAAIGASILVTLCTFIGVIFTVPVISRMAKDNFHIFSPMASAFAAGALLAAAFYLMLYEATHLIAITEERPESLAAATWGSMILLGFVTASILDLFVAAFRGQSEEAPQSSNKEAAVTTTSEGAAISTPKQMRILSSVLLGDFVHNLVDGVFIGVAFVGCSTSLAWSITAATIFHELAQEISDYFVLTDPLQGALSSKLALLLNFLSGFSVILGTIIILALREIDDAAVGMLLAFGGGVYLQIGAAECMARVYADSKTVQIRAMALLAFVVGATAIGLVLLDHQHCSPGGHAHGH